MYGMLLNNQYIKEDLYAVAFTFPPMEEETGENSLDPTARSRSCRHLLSYFCQFDTSKRSCCPRRPGPMLLGGWSTIGPTSHALIPSYRRQA